MDDAHDTEPGAAAAGHHRRDAAAEREVPVAGQILRLGGARDDEGRCAYGHHTVQPGHDDLLLKGSSNDDSSAADGVPRFIPAGTTARSAALGCVLCPHSHRPTAMTASPMAPVFSKPTAAGR